MLSCASSVMCLYVILTCHIGPLQPMTFVLMYLIGQLFLMCLQCCFTMHVSDDCGNVCYMYL